jgi:chemotaxis receptor (MCP) glutamine deamidase CheD
MEVNIKLLQSWTGREKIRIEKVASGMAVILWDPVSKKASATHFFTREDKKIEEKLKEMLTSLGVDHNGISRIRAKIIGGADVAGLQVGKKFAATVVEAMKKLGIPIGGYDLGGNITRNVSFDPVTGKCIVSYLTGGAREI